MAWNLSPEVAVARDAAKQLGDLAKSEAIKCVVFYITEDGRIGYVAYGKTKAACDDAKRLADAMYEAAMNHFGK